MKFLISVLVLSLNAATMLTAAPAQTPTPADERVEAAFLLALGRRASSEELGKFATRAGASVSDYVAQLRDTVQHSPDLQRSVAAKAYIDSFGVAPSAANVAAAPAGAFTYTEQMKAHALELKANPELYRQVIERAYERAVRRPAYSGEHDYWKEKPVLSYALLVACIEDWGRRNSPGLMETTGIPAVSYNSRFLTSLALSPAVAEEARTAIGFSAAGDNATGRVFSPGRNLVAVTGESLFTSARMHLVAVGSDVLLLPN